MFQLTNDNEALRKVNPDNISKSWKPDEPIGTSDIEWASERPSVLGTPSDGSDEETNIVPPPACGKSPSYHCFGFNLIKFSSQTHEVFLWLTNTCHSGDTGIKEDKILYVILSSVSQCSYLNLWYADHIVNDHPAPFDQVCFEATILPTADTTISFSQVWFRIDNDSSKGVQIVCSQGIHSERFSPNLASTKVH
jgi:hypothetical protein